MDLPVTIGVQEHSVRCRLTTPMGPPDDMMVMPSRQSGDLLVADRTETLLLFPQIQQLPSTFQGLYHFHAEAFFEVHFPWRVLKSPLSLEACQGGDKRHRPGPVAAAGPGASHCSVFGGLPDRGARAPGSRGPVAQIQAASHPPRLTGHIASTRAGEEGCVTSAGTLRCGCATSSRHRR
jgi:hypothetical protein